MYLQERILAFLFALPMLVFLCWPNPADRKPRGPWKPKDPR